MYQENNETSLAPCRVFKAHKEYLTRLLLSPDIKLLATCSSDHTVKIWRVDPNEELLEAVDESEFANLTTTTPSRSTTSFQATNFGASTSLSLQSTARPSSSTTMHTNNSSTSSLSTTHSQSTNPPVTPLITHRRPLPLETTLENHQRWVWDCAFSADSAYLVTVSSDHYARLWELATSSIIRQYSGHHRGAVCVALNDYSGAGG